MWANSDQPLLRCIKNSDCSGVRSLIAAGANVNRAYDFRTSETCLHLAMGYKSSWNQNVQAELVEILLSAGANVLAIDSWSNTCLHLAAESDRTGHIVELLLKAGAGKLIGLRNRSNRTALQVAVLYGCEDFNESSGRVSVVEKLIGAGADPREGCEYLHLLCGGNVEMLRFFMEVSGLEAMMRKVNRDGLTPLQIGVKHDVAIDILERMIGMGADVNFLSAKDCAVGTPLHIAAWYGFDDKVEMLLRHGADPAKLNNRLETAMYLASKNLRQSGNYVNVFRSLIKHGADVNDGGPGGFAPFETVVENGNLDAVKFFLDLDDRGVLDPPEEPLLHSAAANADYPILRHLLDESVCEVDETNDEGFTALHTVADASFANSHLHAQMLLDAGADINAKGKDGQSVLDFAIRRGDPKTMQILVRHIALSEMKHSYVDPENFGAIAQNVGAESVYENCKAELNLMQSSVIEGSVTYYSILARKNWVRNELVVEKLEAFDWSSDAFRSSFPNYFDLVHSNFVQMIARRELVENAIMGLERILWMDFDVFHTIYYKILSYLRKEDLINLHGVALCVSNEVLS